MYICMYVCMYVCMYACMYIIFVGEPDLVLNSLSLRSSRSSASSMLAI